MPIGGLLHTVLDRRVAGSKGGASWASQHDRDEDDNCKDVNCKDVNCNEDISNYGASDDDDAGGGSGAGAGCAGGGAGGAGAGDSLKIQVG